VTSGVSNGGAAGMAGNVILGGLIGAVVDGASGAMNDLRPNPLQVAMVPQGGSAPAPAAAEAPTVLSWDGQTSDSPAEPAAEPVPVESPAAEAPTAGAPAAETPAAAAPSADAAAAPERG
jgi:hypothetical protein